MSKIVSWVREREYRPLGAPLPPPWPLRRYIRFPRARPSQCGAPHAHADPLNRMQIPHAEQWTESPDEGPGPCEERPREPVADQRSRKVSRLPLRSRELQRISSLPTYQRLGHFPRSGLNKKPGITRARVLRKCIAFLEIHLSPVMKFQSVLILSSIRPEMQPWR